MGADLPDDGARQVDDGISRAVAESTAELHRRWPAWCAARNLAAPDQPVVEPPVIYQVGASAERLEWVALIRFHAAAGGQSWSGLVRGPLGDVTFRVVPAPATTDRSGHTDHRGLLGGLPAALADRVRHQRTRQR